MNKLLLPAEVAERLRLSVGTLANWRIQGRERLPFVRLHGGKGGIRYEEAVVEQFITDNRHFSTSEIDSAA